MSSRMFCSLDAFTKQKEAFVGNCGAAATVELRTKDKQRECWKYLPTQWNWECWCHIQRKAVKPGTSACHQSLKRNSDNQNSVKVFIQSLFLVGEHSTAITKGQEPEAYSRRKKGSDRRRFIMSQVLIL